MTDYTHKKCGNGMIDIVAAFQRKVFFAKWCATCEVGIVQPYRKSKKFGFVRETYSRVHDTLRDLQKGGIYLCPPRYLRDVLKLDAKTLESYLTCLMQESPQAIWYSPTPTKPLIEISKTIPLPSVFLDYTQNHPDILETD